MKYSLSEKTPAPSTIPCTPQKIQTDFRYIEHRTGPAVVRIESYVFEPAIDQATGRPKQDPKTGGQTLEAVAARGELVCSQEKVELRLADPNATIPNRRTIEDIRQGTYAKPGLEDMMRDPASLPPEQRPVWRCDQSVFLKETHDGYHKLLSKWISPYCNYIDEKNTNNYSLMPMETKSFSTLTYKLKPEYYKIFRTEMANYGKSDEQISFLKACWRTANIMVETHKQSVINGQDECIGQAYATTWRPDQRYSFGITPNKEEVKKLAAFFADPKFQAINFINDSGQQEEHKSNVEPELIIRYMNAVGQVCGQMHISNSLFYKIAHAQAISQGFDSSYAKTMPIMVSPEEKARYILKNLPSYIGVNSPDSNSKEKIISQNLLVGDCHALSKTFSQYGAFGRTSDRSLYDMRTALTFALSQTRLPFPSETPRQHIGCAQFFITRTKANIVASVFRPIDGRDYMNAVLLNAGNSTLPMSEEYAREVRDEQDLLKDFTNTMREVLAMQEQERLNTMQDSPQEEASSPDAVPF